MYMFLSRLKFHAGINARNLCVCYQCFSELTKGMCAQWSSRESEVLSFSDHDIHYKLHIRVFPCSELRDREIV